MHPNQIGFVKGGHLTNNIHRLITGEDYANTQNHKAIVVSLDEEKAFVRVPFFPFCYITYFSFYKFLYILD